VANPEHLELLRQGVDVWNAWRAKEPSIQPDLRDADLGGARLNDANLAKALLVGANLGGADLRRADLSRAGLLGANLSGADLREANLSGASLSEANAREADLRWANLSEANARELDLRGARLQKANLFKAYLGKANLSEAVLSGANLSDAHLSEANLSGADLSRAGLFEAVLSGANLSEANLFRANLHRANVSDADLSWARLHAADLTSANLSGTNLSDARLVNATLVNTNLAEADLTGCSVHGVSAWGLKLEKAKQQNLIITRERDPEITVDNIEVAQFVYLLLHNEKIRDVIDTVGKKGVLLLGRFTEGRIDVLNRLREELRQRGYLPIVFNFDKPETKDFTETVRLLAGLSKFVIADITNPKSAPLELQATVPEIMVPFRPIIEEGEKPFAM
jgi:uncharacterized protein YjbI with pentapeptide repeats